MQLKYIVLGGEKFPPLGDILPMAEKGVQFYNAYGVTEMSVWQSLIKVKIRRDSLHMEVPIWCTKEEPPIWMRGFFPKGDSSCFTDVGLKSTWLKLVREGEVVDPKDVEMTVEGLEGEVAIYSDVRHCVQSPPVLSEQG